MANFNHWSFGAKLRFLSFSLLLSCIGLGAYSYKNLKEASHEMADIADNQMQAVRAADLADMMHDGVRGIVFQGIYAASEKDLQVFNDVKNDMLEAEKTIIENIEKIATYDLDASTIEAQKKALPDAKAYVEIANKILIDLSSGRTDSGKKNLSDFNDKFKALLEAG